MSNDDATPNDKEIPNNPEVEEVAESGPFQINDATVFGEIPQDVLDLSLVLGCGRNEQDKRWPGRRMTWAQLVNTLSSHKVGPKEGTAFLQGSAIDNARKAKAIDSLYIMGLDVDSGVNLQWAIDRMKELGLSSVIYTTHSNMKDSTFVLENSFGQFARRNKLDQFPTLETMKRFLKEERKWEQWVVDTVELNDDPEQTVLGKGFALKHAPMPKFRIVLPLSEAYKIAKQRMSHDEAIDQWKSKLVGLSKVIGLPIDEATLDPSRLFFMPRHGQGKPFQVVVTGGKALDFDAIPEGRARRGEPKIDDNVFADAAKDLGAGGAAHMIGDFNLRAWARKSAKSFDICKLFREVAPSHVRADDNTSKLAVDCPFNSFHSNAGDTDDRGGWVQSPSAELGAYSFAFACSHNSCKGRDRLEMIAEAVSQSWFTVDDLKDERFTTFSTDDKSAVVPNNSGHIFDSADAAIDALNKIAAVMRVGAKTLYLVCEEEGDELTFKTKAAAEDWFANWLIATEDKKGQPKVQSAFDVWRRSTKRRQYNRVVFRPDGDRNPDHYNIWTGFKVAPKDGDWRLLQRHMYEVLCNRDPELFEYFLAWFGQLFQQPEVKPGVALVIFSKDKGTGKSILMNPLRRILRQGVHATTLSSSKSLTSQFNTHMERSLLVCGEEVVWGGNREAIGPLKAAITEPTTRLEKKNINAVEIDNFSRFYLVSNEDRCIPAEGDDERRFFALRAGMQHKQDVAYFKAILKQLDNGGTAAFLNDLLNFDYERVELRRPPRTEALAAQTEANLDAAERWWLSVLADGAFFDADGNQSDETKDWETKEVQVLRNTVFNSYNATVKTYGMSTATRTAIGTFLGKMVPGLRDRKSGPKRWYILPSLEECRKAFERATGVRFQALEGEGEVTSISSLEAVAWTPTEAWLEGPVVDANGKAVGRDTRIIGMDGKPWRVGPTDPAEVDAYCDRFHAAGHLMSLDADIQMVLGGGLGMEAVLWFKELDRQRDKAA